MPTKKSSPKSSSSDRRRLILISLDGWGLSPMEENNPIALAKKPHYDRLVAQYPYGVLDAAGLSVGLPWGQVGNSEVGHLTLGAGTVLYQNQPRINLAIENGEFFKNKVLLDAIAHAKKNRGKLHIYGIASPGGVHGHIDHIVATAQAARKAGLKNVFVHCITDGRDSPPQSAIEYIKSLEAGLKKAGAGRIATLCGRFYAMDRNNTWDRTQKAYDLITKGIGTAYKSAQDAIKATYATNNTDDEQLPPAYIASWGKPLALIERGDAVVMTNYREDRARQIAHALSDDDFKDFDRGAKIEALYLASFVEYESTMKMEMLFPPEHIERPFGMLIAEHGLSQLRIAETEKFAHVTFFFNGGTEAEYKGEERVLVPSPHVRTYDMQPEMSAYPLTKKLLALYKKKPYDFVIINFANADMVGHTGNMDATIKGVEAVDECIGQIIDYTEKEDIIAVITADHGNAEIAKDPLTGGMNKEHSTSPVPIIVVDPRLKREKSPEEVEMLKNSTNAIGILADVAPTLCVLMGIEQPHEMTGKDILPSLM